MKTTMSPAGRTGLALLVAACLLVVVELAVLTNFTNVLFGQQYCELYAEGPAACLVTSPNGRALLELLFGVAVFYSLGLLICLVAWRLLRRYLARPNNRRRLVALALTGGLGLTAAYCVLSSTRTPTALEWVAYVGLLIGVVIVPPLLALASVRRLYRITAIGRFVRLTVAGLCALTSLVVAGALDFLAQYRCRYDPTVTYQLPCTIENNTARIALVVTAGVLLAVTFALTGREVWQARRYRRLHP